MAVWLKQKLNTLQDRFYQWYFPKQWEANREVPVDRLRIAETQRARAPKRTEMQAKIAELKTVPLFSIIMPVYNPPAEVLRKTLDSILDQGYPHWELCATNDCSTEPIVKKILDEYASKDKRVKVTHLRVNSGISGASNKSLAMASGDFVCLVDHDDLLFPDSLYQVALVIDQNPSLDYIYSDSAIINMQDQFTGFFFKPDFNWELFQCHNWVGQLSTIRRNLVKRVGGWLEGREGQDYDLFLKCLERTDRVHHIPRILYCWRQAPNSIATRPENKPRTQDDQRMALRDSLKRRAINADITDLNRYMYRVRYPMSNTGRVSIIACLLDHHGNYFQILDQLNEMIRYPDVEVILLLNKAPAIQQPFREQLPVKCLSYDPASTLPENLNLAVNQAEGNYLCFVFTPFLAKSENWLMNLLEQAQRPEIGMVGPLLLNMFNRIESAGVVLSQLGPYSIYKGCDASQAGDANSLLSYRSYLLLSGNLAMVSKADFEAVGGFDTLYHLACFDYDLCMKLNQKNKVNLYVPETRIKLKTPENFYPDKLFNSPDHKYFKIKWKRWYGRDGNLNFQVQHAMNQEIAKQLQLPNREF